LAVIRYCTLLWLDRRLSFIAPFPRGSGTPFVFGMLSLQIPPPITFQGVVFHQILLPFTFFISEVLPVPAQPGVFPQLVEKGERSKVGLEETVAARLDALTFGTSLPPVLFGLLRQLCLCPQKPLISSLLPPYTLDHYACASRQFPPPGPRRPAGPSPSLSEAFSSTS